MKEFLIRELFLMFAAFDLFFVLQVASGRIAGPVVFSVRSIGAGIVSSSVVMVVGSVINAACIFGN